MWSAMFPLSAQDAILLAEGVTPVHCWILLIGWGTRSGRHCSFKGVKVFQCISVFTASFRVPLFERFWGKSTRRFTLVFSVPRSLPPSVLLFLTLFVFFSVYTQPPPFPPLPYPPFLTYSHRQCISINIYCMMIPIVISMARHDKKIRARSAVTPRQSTPGAPRTAEANYYYYHQPGPCVANKWHAIFAMIKSAGDSLQMSGFKNRFPGYVLTVCTKHMCARRLRDTLQAPQESQAEQPINTGTSCNQMGDP